MPGPRRVYRGACAARPRSPQRWLYGHSQGFLLAPLDICLWEFEGGEEVLRPPDTQGLFMDCPLIKSSSDATLGRIAQYDWPPGNPLDVSPVVRVEFDGEIPDWVPSGEGHDPAAQVGDAVQLLPNGTEGVISDALGPQPYISADFSVMAYAVAFEERVRPNANGARAVLLRGDSKTLLGMLIAPQQPDGAFDGLVFPAHLVADSA